MKLQSLCSYIFNPRSFPTFKNIRKYQHIIRYFTDLLKLKYFVTFIEKSSACPSCCRLFDGDRQQPLPLLMMRSRCSPMPYPLLTPRAIMRQGRGIVLNWRLRNAQPPKCYISNGSEN
ncbi:hypothetical protein CEXT_340661 [Caerostris extrusa]|uniref:Uncharacterized protein n=1 Tax=Caerostris extrusa TaxID=172846 RepID=A0AAV4TD02_CAEEX|nr:hypothetical protein CEXT_340661 [Caerostris extrusa]